VHRSWLSVDDLRDRRNEYQRSLPGCGGQHALGDSCIVGSFGMGHPMDVWLTLPSNLKASIPIISGLEPAKGFWFDAHFSWNNVDPNDSARSASTHQPTPDGDDYRTQIFVVELK
jgi:hypothetical protein